MRKPRARESSRDQVGGFSLFSGFDSGGPGIPLLLSAWVVSAALAVWAVFFVPMNMDEALYYHPIACFDHPFSYLHVFRDACGPHNELRLFFGVSLPMSLAYTGIFSALIYAPFHYLFHGPAGQYVFGIMCLLLFAWQMTRLGRASWLSMPLVSAFFPVAYQFIHDTGPIKFPFLLFTTAALLARGAGERKKTAQAALSILSGLLTVAAVYDKIFLLFLLPGLFFFILAFVYDGDDWAGFTAAIGKIRPAVFLTAAIVCAGTAVLLSAVGPDGKSYLDRLRSLEYAESAPLTQFLRFLLLYLTFWPAYAHRAFDAIDVFDPQNIVFVCLAGGLLAAGILGAISGGLRLKRPRTVMLLLSFASIIAVFSIFRNIWAGHHFVFMWIPLLAIFVEYAGCAAGMRRTAFLSLFLVLNLLCVFVLAPLPQARHSARDRQTVLNHFQDERLAGKSVVTYISWGGYFLHALYGPRDQLITYIQPMNEKDSQKLLDISRQTGRDIYIVCLTGETIVSVNPWPHAVRICDGRSLEKMFGNELLFEEYLPGQKDWRVFKGTAPRREP